MKTPEGYIEMSFDLGKAYVKESRLMDISKIDSIIFDCDGVLIDVRGSYDKAISKATTWIFEMLTGYSIPEELISSEIIFLFRKSGGFNIDSDIIYGLLMFLLSELPVSSLRELAEIIRAVGQDGGIVKRIQAVKERVRAKGIDINIDANGLIARLEWFTSMLDDTGVTSVDRVILTLRGVPEGVYTPLKNFLYGSKRVSEDIIATVFEEVFCGPSLFREMYNLKPVFFNGSGTIKNSKVIIRRETLNKLSSLIGRARFGIASGSMLAPAKYVLGSILEDFNLKALTFLDNIREIEEEYSSRGLLKISLIKPNPYSLFRSAWSLEPFRKALFIGDSMEDALMVNKANELDPRFIFAGVYAYTGVEDRALQEFLKFGCDIVSPSVNEIPLIIEAVRGDGA
ncbi:MAG: hypothetical protein QXR13_02995 [Candidatus Bathyarchaeia archaeon]